MRRTRLLSAIGVILWGAVVACSQAGSPRGTVRCAAGPHEGRAVRNRHVHQRVAARRPRRAADAVRQPGSRHRRAWSRVSGHRRDRRIRSCPSVGWSRRGARPITASSTTSAAASPTRGRQRSFTGRRTLPVSSWGGSRHAAWPRSTRFGTPFCPARSKARPSSGSSTCRTLKPKSGARSQELGRPNHERSGALAPGS